MIAGVLSGLPAFADRVEASPATEIWDWYDLDAVRNNLDGDYILMNDLDSTTIGYSELASPADNQGMGWEPIGAPGDPFRGTFDGGEHNMCDLYIYRPAQNVGLFSGVTEGSTLENIGILNVTVTAYQHVGGLLGVNAQGTVINCYATGSVTGDSDVGCLIGSNYDGIVNSCYATGTVTGDRNIGGLMGRNDGTVSDCHATASMTGSRRVGGLVGENTYTISNCYASGNATDSDDIGGLVGRNDLGLVTNCYATGSVTGYDDHVGGMVGENYEGVVSKSYAMGNIIGDDYVGGLVGDSAPLGTIDNCYAMGSVTGAEYIGGLVGINSWSTVSNCYATGCITGYSYVGGLVGLNDYGLVINCFWDTETSGQSASASGTGKNTTEMRDIATFTDIATEGLNEPWDMTAVTSGGTNRAYIWNIVEDESYPFLSMGKTGDVNNDDSMSVLDMVLIGQHWGETGSSGWIPEDVNKDGVVDVLDMIIIGQNWTG